MRPILLAAALTFPLSALAAGGMDAAPPQPTETTTVCADGKVWDAGSESCVAPHESRLDDDALYRAARELAHAGRYEAAQEVLGSMSDPSDDRVLTYLGFTHRKMGDIDRGMACYRAALEANPGNLLARSYLGEALAEAGETARARAELSEIRRRGGRGTWAEIALRLAIEAGRTPAY